MRTRLCFLIAIVTVLSFGVVQAQDKILVSYDGHAGFQGPIWIAKDLGLFEKHGLNVELIMIPGGTRAMQALASGSIQFAQGSASAPLSLRAQGGEVVIIAGALNKFPFSMVTQKEIRKPGDLVGKKIGIVNFGGSNELAVNLALKEWNIPRSAVTLIPAGEAANRLIALSTKSLDASVLAPPHTVEAARLGLHTLANLSDLAAAFPMTTISVRRSFIDKQRDTVKRFVRAYSEAIYQFMTSKESAAKVYSKRLKQQNSNVIDETYNYYAKKFSFPPRTNRDGLRNAFEILPQRAAAGKAEFDPEQFLDETIIVELEKEGFFSKLNRGTTK